MARYLSILFFFLIISCSQNSSQAEKDYFRNLEKNRALEKELMEAKSGSDPFSNSQVQKQNSKDPADFFTIGSTIEEVIKVMGEPTSYLYTTAEARKFHYGISTVFFYHGEVISFDNLGENLKVRVKK